VLKRLIKPPPPPPPPGVASKGTSPEPSTANGEAAPPAKGTQGEDYDARLDEELETLER